MISELCRPLTGFDNGDAFKSKRVMRVRLMPPLGRRQTSMKKAMVLTKSLTFQGRSGDVGGIIATMKVS